MKDFMALKKWMNRSSFTEVFVDFEVRLIIG